MTDEIKKIRRSGLSANVGCFFLAFASWLVLNATEVRGDVPKEYQVKAAFLLNFSQYIEWPATAFPDASTPITIGVLGDDPFGAVLDKTVEGESVQGRKIVIKRSKQVGDLKECHLLFISKSEQGTLGDILKELKRTSVVTVGEVSKFTQRGGIINFYLDGNKVRFEINPNEAKRRGLKISSQLLKLGKVTESDSGD